MTTKSEYIAWRDHPITVEFLHAIWKKREFTKEGLSNAEVSDTGEIHRHIGRCIGYQEILDYATKEFDYIEENE